MSRFSINSSSLLKKTNFLLNFGPQHPAAHGVLRLVLELCGERVSFVDPHIGFLHRGTEKLIESKTYLQALPYFDRLDYVSMLAQEHSFVLAIEYLLNLKVSRRSRCLRVLLDELTRLLNHLMCITTHALDIGALTPFLWGFEEREKILGFYEEISGARMHAAFYRIGGLCQELPENFLDKVFSFAMSFLNFIDILEDLLSNNTIWVSRLKGVGEISTATAFDFSFSGPLLRGSGIPWDLRKLQSYDDYSSYIFNIPVGFTNDCLSRYYVRLYEMRESLNIIFQCLDRLNNFYFFDRLSLKDTLFSFSLSSDFPGFLKNFSKFSMEELIFHFKHFSKGFTVPKGSVYMHIEAPKGETGVYLVSDHSSKPFRCKIKSPGFLHLQGLNFLSKNHLLADLVTNIGTIDIVFGEIDR